MDGSAVEIWEYASITLRQPPWPGRRPAEWVAMTAAGERHRSPDALEVLNLMGQEGWEVVAFAPEHADRSTSFYLKARRDRAH